MGGENERERTRVRGGERGRGREREEEREGAREEARERRGGGERASQGAREGRRVGEVGERMCAHAKANKAAREVESKRAHAHVRDGERQKEGDRASETSWTNREQAGASAGGGNPEGASLMAPCSAGPRVGGGNTCIRTHGNTSIRSAQD